jgi:hypothetical protein
MDESPLMTEEEIADFMRKAFPVSAKEEVGNYIEQLKPFFPERGVYFINACDEDQRSFRIYFRDLRGIPQYVAVNESYVSLFSIEAFETTLLGAEAADFPNLAINPNISPAGTLSAWMKSSLDKFEQCLTDSVNAIGAHRKKIASEGNKAHMVLYKREPFLAYLQEAQEQSKSLDGAQDLETKIASDIEDAVKKMHELGVGSGDLIVIHKVQLETEESKKGF